MTRIANPDQERQHLKKRKPKAEMTPLTISGGRSKYASYKEDKINENIDIMFLMGGAGAIRLGHA